MHHCDIRPHRLIVLFLAVWRRAILLMQGETEKYKMPQLRTQIVMPSRVYAVLVQVGIVLIIPVLTHVSEVIPDEHGSLDMSRVEKRWLS